MKTCKKCDIIYGDDKKFCKKCGSSLSQEYNIEQKELAKKIVFEERLKADPLNTSLLLEYAQFLYANLLFKEATSKLLIILAINQNQEEAKELLYKCYFKLNLHKEALDIGEQLLEKRKTDIALLEELAEIATELDNKEKVIEYCNTILELQPSNTKALYSKAIALLEQNEFENATAILTQLYKEGNKKRIVTIYAGINECLLGNYKEAIETLTPILLNEDPSLFDIDNQRGYLYLSYSLCKTQNTIEEIVQWYNFLDFELINAFKHPVDEETIAKAVIEIFNIYFADLVEIRVGVIESFINKYINEASICFSEHTNSYVADIWNKIAEVQESANLLKEAQISLKKAIELSPESAEYKDKIKHIADYLAEKKKKKKRSNTVFGILTVAIIVSLTISYFFYNNYSENKTWKIAKNTNTCESFQEFLEKYPESKYFRLGKKKLNSVLKTSGFSALFIEENVCPFEGCQYGVWTARRDVNVYEYKTIYSNIMGKIKNGEKVNAIKGDMVFSKIGKVLVTESFNNYSKGDTVNILSYRGEGNYSVSHKGKMQEAFIFWASPNSAGQDIKGIMLNSSISTWWVYVKSQSSTQGWVIQKDGLFSGASAIDYYD